MLTKYNYKNIDLERHLIYTQQYQAVNSKVFYPNLMKLFRDKSYYECIVNIFFPTFTLSLFRSSYDKRGHENVISLVIDRVIGFSVIYWHNVHSITQCIRDTHFLDPNRGNNYKFSDLFTHLAYFISKPDIKTNLQVYNGLKIEVNKVTQNIINDFSKKYPETALHLRTTDKLRDYIMNVIEETVSQKAKRKYDEIINHLLEKNMTVEIGRLMFSLNKIIRVKPILIQNEKKEKIIFVNMAILSCIKAIPLNLWRVNNKDAIQLVIRPHINYKILNSIERSEFINKFGLYKYETQHKFSLNDEFSVILKLEVSFDIEVYLIKLLINPAGVSFILNGGVYKSFVGALIKTIDYVLANIYRSGYLTYLPIPV